MNLIVDIGNTKAKIALVDGGKFVFVSNIDTVLLCTRLPQMLEGKSVCRGIVSTVVGLDSETREAFMQLGFPVMVFDNETPLPIVNDYLTPKTLGPDRLAAAMGAWARWKGQNVLVVDAGSCITYELLTADGHYKGGNIAPGLRMRLKAMNEHTAKLPLVDANGDVPLMGYDTLTAMRSGVVRGLAYEVEGYVRHLEEKYGALKLVLTGGDSMLLETMIEEAEVDAELVLRGLDYILSYNEKDV